MRASKNAWKNAAIDEDVDMVERACDHPDCAAEGAFRAPKSRNRLNEYFWFCLDHVRAYNKSWNYYAGLSDEEVENSMRSDTVWQRRTRPLGSWRAREHWLREKIAQGFDPDGPGSGTHHSAHRAPPTGKGSEIDQAMVVLELSYPLDLATAKTQYKFLVKKHHPDANGGAKSAEEKLKAINIAYGVLKAALSH